MQEQTYPFLISFYKGDKQLLIVPYGRHTGGYSIHLNFFNRFDGSLNNKDIGNSVVDMIKKIKNSPLSFSTSEEQKDNVIWRKASKYKSYKSFCKNYLSCCLEFFENGEYKITALRRASEKGGYNGCIKDFHLASTATIEEIGEAILDAFQVAEEFYKKN